MKSALSIILLFFIASVLLRSTYGQNENECACNQSGGFTTWGTFVGESSCIGRCDNAALVRMRYCHVFDDAGRFIDTTACRLAEKSDCGECSGAWSSWGSASPCTGTCGRGVQLQLRACYRKDAPGRNIRNNECAGEVGVVEQSRNVSCRRSFLPCPSTAPITTPMKVIPSTPEPPNTVTSPKIVITPSTAATIPETSTAMPTISTTTSATMQPQTTTSRHEISRTPSSRFTARPIDIIFESSPSVLVEDLESDDIVSPSDSADPDQPTLLSPDGFDTVTLAAVLGSVAIICVTIVAVAVAIVFLKKQEAKKKALSLPVTSNNSFVKPVPNARRNDLNFNSVECPLPSETSAYGQVANPLYETTLMNGEPIITEVAPKLPPLSHQRRISNNVNRNGDVDAIYFSVDDHNR